MTPGFTEDQRQVVGRYVRATANAMGLRDWLFELMFDPPPVESAFAMVRPTYGRKVAAIWFQRHFAELEPEKARHAIVHELAHCITDPITTTLENVGKKLLPTTTFDALWEATRERSELATDHIADILEAHIPLIDWTDTGEAERVEWSDAPSDPVVDETPRDSGQLA